MYKRPVMIMTLCLATAWVALPVAFAQENPSGEQVIDSYLQAIGGQKALAAIQDRTTKGTFTVMGMSGTILIQEKVPNMAHSVFDVGMAKVESWFDGNQGYRLDPNRGDGPFSPEEVAEAKENPTISPLLNYKDRGLKLRYVKKEKEGDGEADVVEATDPKGKVVTYYFDTAKHYLVKTVAPSPEAEGGGSQEITVSDYRDVNGLKFPFKMARATSAMTLEMVVDSIEVNTGLADTVFQHSAN